LCLHTIPECVAKNNPSKKAEGTGFFYFYLSLVLLCLLLKLCQGTIVFKIQRFTQPRFYASVVSESGDKDMEIIFQRQTFQRLILKISSFNQSAKMTLLSNSTMYQ